MSTTNNNQVPQDMQSKVNEMLDTFGLNWIVKQIPTYFKDGKGIEHATGMVGLVREDKNICFNTVPESYVPYQNDELAYLLIRLCEKTGYSIYNGGMFDDGAKVYMQLKTGDRPAFGKNEGDRIETLATAINYHNYNGSGKWGHTNVTISCANTFNYADRILSKQNTFRHTKKMHMRIEEALRDLDRVHRDEEKTMKNFEILANAKMTDEALIEVVKTVTTVDMAIGAERFEAEYKPITLAKMDELLACIYDQTQEKGDTFYGLFNGVTQWSSHVKNERTAGNREASKYLSTGLQLDNKVFTQLLSMA